MYIGRFAPSPTGPLHFGSLTAALASYLDARARGGDWLLRIEDVDTVRCRAAHADTIIHTLAGLGFRWDGEIWTQSQRTPHYEAALEQLAGRDRLYGCRCTRREIADAGPAGIDGPVYPGTCATLALCWRRHVARFRTTPGILRFHDRVQGAVVQDVAGTVGDFVLRRRDGCIAYQLAVVVDDAAAGITHVVRGADLIDSTPRQLMLQQALGVATPSYLHLPVAMDENGQKLSKQTLAPAIAASEGTALLIRALRFLGQDTADLAARAPAMLLTTAAQRWRPEAIPSLRDQPAAVAG